MASAARLMSPVAREVVDGPASARVPRGEILLSAQPGVLASGSRVMPRGSIAASRSPRSSPWRCPRPAAAQVAPPRLVRGRRARGAGQADRRPRSRSPAAAPDRRRRRAPPRRRPRALRPRTSRPPRRRPPAPGQPHRPAGQPGPAEPARKIVPVQTSWAKLVQSWAARRRALHEGDPAGADAAQKSLLSAQRELGIENLLPLRRRRGPGGVARARVEPAGRGARPRRGGGEPGAGLARGAPGAGAGAARHLQRRAGRGPGRAGRRGRRRLAGSTRRCGRSWATSWRRCSPRLGRRQPGRAPAPLAAAAAPVPARLPPPPAAAAGPPASRPSSWRWCWSRLPLALGLGPLAVAAAWRALRLALPARARAAAGHGRPGVLFALPWVAERAAALTVLDRHAGRARLPHRARRALRRGGGRRGEGPGSETSPAPLLAALGHHLKRRGDLDGRAAALPRRRGGRSPRGGGAGRHRQRALPEGRPGRRPRRLPRRPGPRRGRPGRPRHRRLRPLQALRPDRRDGEELRGSRQRRADGGRLPGRARLRRGLLRQPLPGGRPGPAGQGGRAGRRRPGPRGAARLGRGGLAPPRRRALLALGGGRPPGRALDPGAVEPRPRPLPVLLPLRPPGLPALRRGHRALLRPVRQRVRAPGRGRRPRPAPQGAAGSSARPVGAALGARPGAAPRRRRAPRRRAPRCAAPSSPAASPSAPS